MSKKTVFDEIFYSEDLLPISTADMIDRDGFHSIPFGKSWEPK